MPIQKPHLFDGIPVDWDRERAVTPALKHACKRDGISLEILTATVLGTLVRTGDPAAPYRVQIASDTHTATQTLRRQRRALQARTEKASYRATLAFLKCLYEARAKDDPRLPSAWGAALEALILDVERQLIVPWPSTVKGERRRQPKRVLAATERRLLAVTAKQLMVARRKKSPNASARTVKTRATQYAFVVLSLNGPSLYPATTDDLIAVLNGTRPPKHVTNQIDSLRQRL